MGEPTLMPIEPWMEGLLDAERMRAVDAWAIEERGVPSLELMERAGAALAEAVDELAGEGPVRVVCGKGNNGGDGLVAARRLGETGFEVDVLLLWPAGELSPDAAENLRRLGGAARVTAHELAPGEVARALEGSGAVVDAIFGTGFEGAPRDPAGTAVGAMNACGRSGAVVVAADVPSGVDASTGVAEGAAVEADVTVAFHAAKLGHWVAPGRQLRGELRVAPIGIPADAPVEPAAGLIGDAVLELAPRRQPGATKFSSGEVLVVGASPGLTGAVCMAAQAAIRAGAGYATVAVPAELEEIFEVKLTEAMSRGIGEGRTLAEGDADAVAEAAARAACVALGPGLGRDESSLSLARALAARIEAPLVIDADGLNAHAGALDSLAGRAAPTVLTPHEGELAGLLGVESSQVKDRRLEHAGEAARLSEAIVVLKGDDTIVCDPRGDVAGRDRARGAAAGNGPGGAGGQSQEPRVAIRSVSSPALATAGTGDVLTGAIAALLARGMEPFAAACAAVHAHGRAGREAARLHGAESVIATDVIEALPAGLGAPHG